MSYISPGDISDDTRVSFQISVEKCTVWNYHLWEIRVGLVTPGRITKQNRYSLCLSGIQKLWLGVKSDRKDLTWQNHFDYFSLQPNVGSWLFYSLISNVSPTEHIFYFFLNLFHLPIIEKDNNVYIPAGIGAFTRYFQVVLFCLGIGGTLRRSQGWPLPHSYKSFPLEHPSDFWGIRFSDNKEQFFERENAMDKLYLKYIFVYLFYGRWSSFI